EQMAALRAHAAPVALETLLGALRGREVRARSVAVTFDDGYADNYTTAVPLLERHDVPATVFLTTGFVGQPREMWWDRLDRILLEPGTLPQIVRVRVGGHLHEWDLGEDAVYTEAGAERHR